jgi:phage-related protein
MIRFSDLVLGGWWYAIRVLGGATWGVEYYETEAGNSPVLEWIEAMPEEEQGLALRYIELLAALGIDARMPLVRPLGHKLFELRWKAKNKQRIAYCAASDRTFVLLHGFTKKQETTPREDMEVAMKRMQDYQRRTAA